MLAIGYGYPLFDFAIDYLQILFLEFRVWVVRT
jgi:hypothetical protein